MTRILVSQGCVCLLHGHFDPNQTFCFRNYAPHLNVGSFCIQNNLYPEMEMRVEAKRCFLVTQFLVVVCLKISLRTLGLML